MDNRPRATKRYLTHDRPPLAPGLVSDAADNSQRGAADIEERQLTQTHEFGHRIGVHEREPRLGDIQQILILEVSRKFEEMLETLHRS